MNIFKVTILFVLALSIALLAGCSDDSPNGPGTELTVEEGQYLLEIEGEVRGIVSGRARFEIDDTILTSEGEQNFVIRFKGGTSSPDTLVFGIFTAPERPDPGTYLFLEYTEGDTVKQIRPGKFLLFGVYVEYDDNGESKFGSFIVSRSGTLTILESSEDRVSGTFSAEIEAERVGSMERVNGTYEGEFIATPGDFAVNDKQVRMFSRLKRPQNKIISKNKNRRYL